jgi:hypothetical protein
VDVPRVACSNASSTGWRDATSSHRQAAGARGVITPINSLTFVQDPATIY